MKRDADYIRELLFEFEDEDRWLLIVPMFEDTPEEAKQSHHVQIMCDAGLMVRVSEHGFRLSNAGHDYLESIRSDPIWRQTKEVVGKTGGSATLELIKTIATAFIKKQIEERTGLEL